MIADTIADTIVDTKSGRHTQTKKKEYNKIFYYYDAFSKPFRRWCAPGNPTLNHACCCIVCTHHLLSLFMEQLAHVFRKKHCPTPFDAKRTVCREYTQAYVWDSLRSEMRKQKKYDEVDLCLNRHLICLIFKAHALAIFFDHSAQLPLSSEGFGDYRAPVRVRYFEHGTKLNGCLL